MAVSHTLVLISVYLLASVVSSSGPGGNCFLKLVRFVKPTDSYRWLCKCPLGPNDPLEPARGVANEFFVGPDTDARNNGTIRCLEAQRTRFTRICNRQPEQFSGKAERVLRRCVNSALTAEEQKDKRPLLFKTDKCTATFFQRNVTGARKGIWACQCKQNRFYFVGTGDAQFSIMGNIREASKEWMELQECTADAKRELQRVCEVTPKDFGVLALHLLQACCKRARVNSDAKFGCRAVVPDNLDILNTIL